MERTYLVLAIDRIPTTNATSRTGRAIVAPVCSLLSVGAIPSHMAGISTGTADDVRREVGLLWTVVLAVTDLTTVLTSLVLIITKRTVERGKLSKLISLELILAFGDRGGLQRIS
jgi:hypothetical protein